MDDNNVAHLKPKRDATANHIYKTVELLGVKISVLPVDSLISYVVDVILQNDKAIVAYANIHAVNIAYETPSFRKFLNDANIVFCDGVGLQIGAKLTGNGLLYRYTPPDWIPSLCTRCVEHEFSIYLLGAQPGVADKAAAELRSDFPALRIAGTHHGYFEKEYNSTANRAVVEHINAVQPDILVLGFGMPMQELWLNENWHRLDSKVAITAGALLDYLAKDVYRAPRWITDNGLEWLARLVVEPKRLWRRYVLGNPQFLWRVGKQRLLRNDSQDDAEDRDRYAG